MKEIIITNEFRKARSIPTSRIETTPIAAADPEWKGRIRSNWWDSESLSSGESFKAFGRSEKEYKDFQLLQEILLSIGGSETCFPVFEEDMEKILHRGRYYAGHSKMMKGRPYQCHANSAELWERNHKDRDVHICTGYALSQDGLWRQHTWLVHRYDTATQHRTRIIETTAKRLAYFGCEMSDEEAEEFCLMNF